MEIEDVVDSLLERRQVYCVLLIFEVTHQFSIILLVLLATLESLRAQQRLSDDATS